MGFLILLGIVVVCVVARRAVTSARKANNAAVRTSLQVHSKRGAPELSSVLADSLLSAGMTKVASFDGTQFFRMNGATQLEVRVQPSADGSVAKVHLPSVRSSNGRPQRLRPVGYALDRAEANIRALDPTADIR